MNLILDYIKDKISLLYPYCRLETQYKISDSFSYVEESDILSHKDYIYIYDDKPLGPPSVAIYMLGNLIFILNKTEMMENIKRGISSLPISHGTEFILSDPNCFDDIIKLVKSILDEKV